MANKVLNSRQAVPGFAEGEGELGAGIKKVEIVSNSDPSRSAEVTNGVVQLLYYESILQDTLRATVTFTDSGNTPSEGGGDGLGKSVKEGLPIDGEETVYISIADNNGNSLDFKKENPFVVNTAPNLSDDTTKSVVQLDLASAEFLVNENSRVNVRFDGKISDHVKRIFEDPNFLNTEKELDIEETSNNYNFIGNNKKPFYWLNKLSQKSAGEHYEKSAGFFFFETYEGFKFKSIDTLLSKDKNKPKKSFIYNQSPTDIPAGYDGKALDYKFENKVNAQKKYAVGSSATKLKSFNPFSAAYNVIDSVADTLIEGLDVLAGGRLPSHNKLIQKVDLATRTTFSFLDPGTLPSGNGFGKTQEQLKKSGDQNFNTEQILNQSIMRYNQLFSAKVTITIPGDFSLHAGDAIFVDAPELQSNTKNDEVSKESGGLYIIADLCHFITPKQTLTKLNLVRDSFGRTGNHTQR